ncbi:MAG: glycosyltransferase family 2 protein [Lachnospiraceae bacterium]|nr:glycosyltransferase family 2 protein [Lachnospiraceae bacterium]
MKSLVIIPAYNEEKSILRTIEDIRSNAADFDYVVINDCSTDGTLSVCRKAGIPVLSLPVNLGIGGAVQTGYLYALKNDYDIAVQFDGDGQHDAAFLVQMRDKLLKDEADLLIGSRFITGEGFQSSSLRRFGIRYFDGLIRFMTGVKVKDPTSGMRMAGRRAIAMFAGSYPKDYPEPESLVAAVQAGLKVEEYPVVMRERKEGVSSISPIRSVYYMIKVTLAIFVERFRRKEYQNT